MVAHALPVGDPEVAYRDRGPALACFRALARWLFGPVIWDTTPAVDVRILGPMHRRGLLAALGTGLLACLGLRPRRGQDLTQYMPPERWDAVDFVRRDRLAPGQIERLEFDFYPGGTEYVLRSAVPGSPERAYLAQAPHLAFRGETLHDLLAKGRLRPEDVMVSLMSAAEIEADRAVHPDWYEPGGASCPFVATYRRPDDAVAVPVVA